MMWPHAPSPSVHPCTSSGVLLDCALGCLLVVRPVGSRVSVVVLELEVTMLDAPEPAIGVVLAGSAEAASFGV